MFLLWWRRKKYAPDFRFFLLLALTQFRFQMISWLSLLKKNDLLMIFIFINHSLDNLNHLNELKNKEMILKPTEKTMESLK